MEYIGYLSSILIGITLGLIGSGGSILTVPVLVYLFSIDVVLATTYSLFIVGLSSAVGSFKYLKSGFVNSRLALLFGLPSLLSVFLTRTFLLPAIPDYLFTIWGLQVSKGIFLLILFALLMIGASFSMIWRPHEARGPGVVQVSQKNGLIVLQGLLVGCVTGLMGAGGGFLIIPALVFLQKLRMKEAVGTSLVIVAANAVLGFLSSHNKGNIHWTFLLLISLLAVTGIYIGMWLSKKTNPARLKPAFGWFILAMGTYIILNELFF